MFFFFPKAQVRELAFESLNSVFECRNRGYNVSKEVVEALLNLAEVSTA